MSKKDTSYSDAMNHWAAKQSFLRNKRNRILHPNPEHPAPVRAIGYFLRVVIVVFIAWIVGGRVARKYFASAGFNDAIKAEVKEFLHAEEIEASNFGWIRKKGICRRIKATGAESAVYRKLDAMHLTFELPMLQRIRKAWTIDELRIEELAVELKSGGKSRLASNADPIPLIAAGLIPKPDFEKLKIKRITCNKADFSWGLSRATLGGITGSQFEAFTDTSNWQIDLKGGKFRQNWLHDLTVNSMRVKRKGDRLELSHSNVRLGRAEKSGTLEGHITLERLPKVALDLKLPQAFTRDLMPTGLNIPEFFYGELDLDLQIKGSINTLSGIETAGTAKITQATFTKVPALEAIDRILNTSVLRIFSPDEGELSFTTGDNKLNVSSFECREKSKGIILRGNFVYSPGIAEGIGRTTLSQIEGEMRVGVRPSMIEGNALAQKYFSDTADGRVWMDIPLSGPLSEATANLKLEILSALKDQ